MVSPVKKAAAKPSIYVILIAIAILVFSVIMIFMLRKAKEGFVSPPYNEVMPMTTNEEAYGVPLNSLKFECSKQCCEPGKMSSMSCNSGCVCKSEYNTTMLSTRGGNAETSTEF